eukprot:1501631-Prymnesium_polylepis.1
MPNARRAHGSSLQGSAKHARPRGSRSQRRCTLVVADAQRLHVIPLAPQRQHRVLEAHLGALRRPLAFELAQPLVGALAEILVARVEGVRRLIDRLGRGPPRRHVEAGGHHARAGLRRAAARRPARAVRAQPAARVRAALAGRNVRSRPRSPHISTCQLSCSCGSPPSRSYMPRMMPSFSSSVASSSCRSIEARLAIEWRRTSDWNSGGRMPTSS